MANLVYELPNGLLNDYRLWKSGNMRKISNFGEAIGQPPPPLTEIKLAIAVKKHAQVDIKVTLPRPAPPDFLIPLQIPCPGL